MKNQLLTKRFDTFFTETGSTRPLALFRIMLIFLLWSRFANDLTLWNASDWTYVALGSVFFILTGLALIGWHTRRVMTLLAGVLALMYFNFGLYNGHISWTHHHVYLLMMCTILCALGPCERSFSLDRYLEIKKTGEAPDENGELLANKLIIFQLAAVYFWAAYDKSNFDFLSGARLDQILHFHYDGTFLSSLMLVHPVIILLAIAIVIIEYLLAFAVLTRKFIKAIFITGFILHIGFYYILPVGTFSLTMMAMYIFLIRPNVVHQFTDSCFAAPKTRHNTP